jgi:hypothetical protein
MKLMAYLSGDIVVYTSALIDGSVTIESSALGDDNVGALYKLYQVSQMQPKPSVP